MMHVRVPCEGDEGVDIEQRYDRSVLVEGSAHHLGRDRRSAGGHADDRQAIGGLDAGGGQPTARELGDDGTERAPLDSGELLRGSDDIVVDLKRGSHGLMLPHLRITTAMPRSPSPAAAGRPPVPSGAPPRPWAPTLLLDRAHGLDGVILVKYDWADRVVIPKAIRDQANLHPGDEVDMVLRDNREIVLVACKRPLRLGGRFAKSGMAARLLEDRAREPR